MNDGIDIIEIETYDGYNQCTHPDIVSFHNRTLLTVTPYPYSDEKYENPCVYYLKGEKFVQLTNNPIESLPDLGFRHHFSDPAFLLSNDKVFLYFRDSLHKDKTRKDIIYRLESIDGFNWENKTIINYSGNACIAPSFIKNEDKIMVFYVVDKQEETFLFVANEIDNSFVNETLVNINNQPTGYTIWHVDVKKHKGVFVGLFAYIDLKKHKGTRLFYATSENGMEWQIINQIEFGKRSNVKNLYKATSYVDSSGRIIALISALDSHMRWFVYKIDITKMVLNLD